MKRSARRRARSAREKRQRRQERIVRRELELERWRSFRTSVEAWTEQCLRGFRGY